MLISNRYKQLLMFAYLGIVYSFALLMFCGAIPPWYSTGLPHRAQTDALLSGDLALSQNVADLKLVPYDLCWSDGGVQQVWGLGIPLWRLPFEALARLVGRPAFPDRVALALFMTLGAFVVLRTWFGNRTLALAPSLSAGESENPGPDSVRQKAKYSEFAVGLGVIVFCLSFAPLMSILRSPMGHYEEVLVFGHFFGIMLLCGIVALPSKPSWSRFWLLCGLAGVGGLIRPTMLFYGGATVAVAGCTMICAKGLAHWMKLLFGCFLFSLGGGALYITNLLRFGSGWEFGHSLNLSPALTLLYSLRFDNPFGHVSLIESARELFGALFLASRFNDVAWYDQGIFPGQSSTIRWRMIDLTTYDLVYAALLAIAWAVGVRLLWQWCRSTGPRSSFRYGGGKLPPIPAVVILWSLFAAIPLAYFYLKVPALASRYLLDFMPAFAAALTGLWWWAAVAVSRWRIFSHLPLAGLCVSLLGWQGWEISRVKSGFGRPRSITCDELLAAMQPHPPIDRKLPIEYQIGDLMEDWRIPYNGEGWNAKDGRLWALAIFFVRDPEFVELEMRRDPKTQDDGCHVSDIRVKVGLEPLQRARITQTNEDYIVHFEGPKESRYQRGIQPVFLGSVPGSKLGNYVIPPSPWILKRICWRDEAQDNRGRPE